MHIFYSNLTTISEIASVVSQFKTPRERFFEISHSNATSPIHIGCLTGSVKHMADSKDFREVMKAKFGLAELGLYFAQSKGDKSDYDRRKFTVHIEIDRQDLPKRDSIESFFNQGKTPSTAFFGTPMILQKPFTYFVEDDVKNSLVNHARKQFSLGKSLQNTTIYGAQLNNWASSSKTETLLEVLMKVESITSKKVIKGKSTKTFRGRLFYAIIPDKSSRSITFYYTKANSSEGRSVARALPLFIRDFFKLPPDFFCDGDFIQSSTDGEWDATKRTFLSSDEKEEIDRLDDMENMAIAEVEVFVSKDQQKAMAMDDDDISEETRLTKGDRAPPPLPDEEMSEMTGCTRESKAKRYANEAVKEVASQYTNTIANMNSNISEKDDKIAELQRLLLGMQNKQSSMPKSDSPAASTPEKVNTDGISISSSTITSKEDSDISYGGSKSDNSMEINSKSSSKRNAIDSNKNTRSTRARTTSTAPIQDNHKPPISKTTTNPKTKIKSKTPPDLTINNPPSSTDVEDMSL